MTHTNEVLKLALEALESERDKYLDWGDEDGAPDDVYEAITAIKQALAQPAPVEPDWKAEYLKSVESGCITLDELREALAELDATNRQVEILSDALAESRREVAALKAVQEPWGYGRMSWGEKIFLPTLPSVRDGGWMALYTTPPSAPTVQEHLSELQKDAANLLFALYDAWPYVHGYCTIESKREKIQALMTKHGEFADLHPPAAQPAPTVQEPLGKLCVFDDADSEFGWSYDISGNAEQHRRLKELDGAMLYTTPPAAEFACSTGLCHYKAVPDALTSADIQEHIEYVAGRNECRQAMLEMMK